MEVTKERLNKGLDYLDEYFSNMGRPSNVSRVLGYYYPLGDKLMLWPALHMLGVTEEEIRKNRFENAKKADEFADKITELAGVNFIFNPERAMLLALEALELKKNKWN